MSVKITFGVLVNFAKNRWPETSDWMKIVAEELGVQYVQYSLDLFDPIINESELYTEALHIKETAYRYDLNIHSVFTGAGIGHFPLLLDPRITMRRHALSWYVNAIKFAANIGAENMGGYLGSMCAKDLKDKRRKDYILQDLIESLYYLTRVAKQYGLKELTWEQIPGQIPFRISEAKKLYERVNKEATIPIPFCIDVGHLAACPEGNKDPYRWISELGTLISIIHIQQTDGKEDRHWPFTEKYNSRGIIEPKKLTDAVETSGAEEMIFVLELKHPLEASNQTVLRNFKESIHYWRNSGVL